MSKMIRNIIVLSIILVMSSISISFGFTDIDNHWGKEAIIELTERGVLNGFEDGTFRPNENVTREQFAKILVEALKLKTNERNVDFIDVTTDRWSHDYIKVASKYLTGYRNNGELYFRPTESSVREDVAVAVVLASGLGDETPDLKVLDQFSDKDEISENLKKYVAIAVEHEIMKGKGGYFDPQGNLTRAEVSQLLLNISEKVVIDDEILDEDLLEEAQFSAFKSEMGSLKEMMEVSMVTAKGEQAIKGNSRTNAQLYNFIARGGEFVLTSDDEGDKKWLIQSDAQLIPCTKIEAKYAERVLGAELPTRYVKTNKSSKEQMAYFVTPKGEVFCFPPYEYDGKSYVNANTTVKDKSGKELGINDATKTKEVVINFEKTNETVKISNVSNEKAIVFERDTKIQDGIGVWYYKSGKIEGIDFSEYDNTVSVYLGDLNKDGKVDFDDEEILYMIIYETRDFDSIDCRRADLNLNGVVDELDYLILQNYLSSNIENLPHKCDTYTIKYNYADIDKKTEHRKVYTCECKETLLKEVEDHIFIKGKCECGFEEIEEEPKSDIEGTIYEKAVYELYDRGIVSFFENGNFYPDKVVTRAEFAKLLVIEEDLEAAADVARGGTVYSDVNKNHWATGYINVASQYGFISGYPDGTFAPDQTVTYAEAITYVVRTLGYKSVVENKGTWPTNYIQKARELNLLDDVIYDNYNSNITRGNTAILLYNMLDAERWVVKDILIGDIDENNIVDEEDLELLRDFLDGENIIIDGYLADVNQDNKINDLDELYLMAYVFNGGGLTKLPHNCERYTYKIDDVKETQHRKNYFCECGVLLLKVIEHHEFEDGKCECGEEEIKGNDITGTIYEEAVNELIERGIMNGFSDGNFKPEKIVTRAEFAKLLVIEEGLEPAADVARGKTIFSDVSENHWATGYINVATEYGFMSGYPDGTFAPDQTVKYSEAITYVLRTLGYKDVVENKGTWPTNYIQKARELKLLDNLIYDNYNSNITRGNTAILLYNMLDAERWKVKVVAYGDVNLDGKINGTDYITLENYLNNKVNLDYEQKLNADVNIDDIVDENDLIILKAFNLKVLDKIPHRCDVTVNYEHMDDSKHKELVECTCGEIDYIERVAHEFVNGKCVCGIAE